MKEIINLVIPTKIASLSIADEGLRFPIVAYDKASEPLFDFSVEEPAPFGDSLLFLDFEANDFSELLSISSIKECEAYEVRHKNRCLYASRTLPPARPMLMSKAECYGLVLEHINELKCIMELRCMLSSYQTNEALAEHEAELIAWLLERRANLPHEVFDDEAYVHCHNYLMARNRDTDEYDFAHFVIMRLSLRIQKYLDSFTNKAKVQFSFAKPLITIECPSAVVAMYIFYAVSDLNKDEYRQCSHKKCGVYYRVDKVHPQKFCDLHMAARRRKRKEFLKNTKERIKEENRKLEEMRKESL